MTALHQAATEALRSWVAASADQEALRQAYLAFLDARDDACRRSCTPGHLTASTVVFDHAGRHVLLTLHPRVGRWLQLGGHCEPGDRSLADAAAREASEESGIAELTVKPEPVHLDVHPVACSLGIPTRHFDVRFVAHAPPDAEIACSDESDDLRWWPLDRLPDDAADLGPLLAAARGDAPRR